MPLIHAKSPSAFKHNMKAEMSAGKPMKQSLAIAYSLKRKAKKMAMGGEMAAMDEDDKMDNAEGSDESQMMDMVGKIMKERQMMYSKGGMVANSGEGELDEMADGKPNNFDDLSQRDDLESSYTGANSGDMLGDARENHDEADLIARIMASRRKKDKLPRPA